MRSLPKTVRALFADPKHQRHVAERKTRRRRSRRLTKAEMWRLLAPWAFVR